MAQRKMRNQASTASIAGLDKDGPGAVSSQSSSITLIEHWSKDTPPIASLETMVNGVPATHADSITEGSKQTYDYDLDDGVVPLSRPSSLLLSPMFNETPPIGSLETVIRGTPATDIDSVDRGATNSDKYMTLGSSATRICVLSRTAAGVKEVTELRQRRPDTQTLARAEYSQSSPGSDGTPTSDIEFARSVSEVQLMMERQSNKARGIVLSDAVHSFLGFPWYTWVTILIAVGCFIAIAVTSALFLGLLCGAAITYSCMWCYTWLCNPDVVLVTLPSVTEDDSQFVNSPLQNLPRNTNESSEERVRTFQGWLNLLEGQSYSPESYHISNTETVYASLEGILLRLKKPHDSHIPKQATWNEPAHNVTFLKEIRVDMRNYVVELQPPGLSVSRLYSKRFPICLQYKSTVVNGNKNTGSLFDNYDVTMRKKSPIFIVLFSRTNKEKEEWFRRLDQASRGFPLTTMVIELQRLNDIRAKRNVEEEEWGKIKLHQRSRSGILSSQTKRDALFNRAHEELLIDYIKYMTNVLNINNPSANESERERSAEKLTPYQSREMKGVDKISLASHKSRGWAPAHTNPTKSGTQARPAAKSGSQATVDGGSAERENISCDAGTMWVNVLLHRIFFDFLREKYWRNKMQTRIQRKLDKINLPYYLGSLIIKEINFGKSLPLIKRIGRPYLSDDGLWIDSQLAYAGSAQMTLETKINLNVLKNASDSTAASSVPDTEQVNNSLTADEEPTTDSDDSSTSGEHDSITTPLDKDPKKGEHAVTKFFNSLKESKYFQKLASTKIVKSALDKVSNTPLKLTVKVKYLSGLFSMNIPPPPTDRLWFGFRGAPELTLTAKPTVGEKSVNLAKLIMWIEQRLITEFQRQFVIPNMVDRKIPFMRGSYNNKSGK